MKTERKERRSPRGGGTMFKRRGFWVKELSLGIGPDGKRRRITVYGKTITQLNEKAAAARRDADSDTPAAGRTMTVGELLDKWYAVVKPCVTEGTAVNYDEHVRLHLKPHVGGIRLKDLRADHVERLLTRLGSGDEPASPAMVRKVFTTFRAALSYGVDKELLNRNPSDPVRKLLPKRDRQVKGTLTPDQARALIAAADGERLAALVDVALDSGCRMGELLAATWADYDADTGSLRITRAVSLIGSRLKLKDVKTAKGARSVVLSFARPALDAHRKMMEAEGRDVVDGLIFCDSRGGHLRRQNLKRRFFDPVAKRAGLDHVTFHWLRHSSASLLLAGGVNVATVAARLGHASPAFTLSTYAHAVNDLHSTAADQLKAILDGPKRKAKKGK